MNALQLIFCKCLWLTFMSFHLLMIGLVHGVTVPFTEDFVADVADWADAGSFPLNFNAAGGPDGSSYASTDFAFNSGGGAGGSSAVLFRGHDEFGLGGSSGGNFIGNWISDEARRLTAFH